MIMILRGVSNTNGEWKQRLYLYKRKNREPRQHLHEAGPKVCCSSPAPILLLQRFEEGDGGLEEGCQQYREAGEVVCDLQANLRDDRLLLMHVLACVWRKVRPCVLSNAWSVYASSRYVGSATQSASSTTGSYCTPH